jgi:hypothetical protein
LPSKPDDPNIFEELGNQVFNPNELANKQLTGFDFAIVIAIEIDGFALLPGVERIMSKKVKELYTSLLARVGSHMLSNVWNVILLPIDLRGYKPPSRARPSRYKGKGGVKRAQGRYQGKGQPANLSKQDAQQFAHAMNSMNISPGG